MSSFQRNVTLRATTLRPSSLQPGQTYDSIQQWYFYEGEKCPPPSTMPSPETPVEVTHDIRTEVMFACSELPLDTNGEDADQYATRIIIICSEAMGHERFRVNEDGSETLDWNSLPAQSIRNIIHFVPGLWVTIAQLPLQSAIVAQHLELQRRLVQEEQELAQRIQARQRLFNQQQQQQQLFSQQPSPVQRKELLLQQPLSQQQLNQQRLNLRTINQLRFGHQQFNHQERLSQQELFNHLQSFIQQTQSFFNQQQSNGFNTRPQLINPLQFGRIGPPATTVQPAVTNLPASPPERNIASITTEPINRHWV